MVAASLPGIPGCGDDLGPAESEETPGTYRFPQGVSSGDPRDSSVVLWTRVAKLNNPAGTYPVRLDVASDAEFRTIVATERVEAMSSSDHTVRVLVTGLAANTSYHYRFTAGRDTITGQTRTAPAATADVQVNLAWVSCQDYAAGNYGAYRQLLIEDEARPEADQIHFVVHLGDAIYETRDSGFQSALDENMEPIGLRNADGSMRVLGEFPSGGGQVGDTNFAETVDDYRHLYKTFLSDPDIMAARARWPFIYTWDDHEFTNDCWQSQANYDDAQNQEEMSQPRKVAANQAWFEYTPAHLSGAPGDASDFQFAAVRTAGYTPPNDDNLVEEPNNLAAIGTMTIYRSLRFGRHVELVMTDERSYRSDHAIPEEFTHNQLFFDSRNALPLPIVNTFDAGRTANGGSPPSNVFTLPNPRVESPPGTVLGAKQKAWWKTTMKGSDATWKLWGNGVPLMRMALKQFTGQPFDRIVNGDAWDGWPTERNELMTYLRTEQIKNVVAISGDIHASFAGLLMDNYDIASPQPVGVELVASGISSNSLFAFYESASRAIPAQVRALISVDASAAGGSAFAENLNIYIRYGTTSAGAYAQTKSEATAIGLADPNANPHIKYADTNAQGYGYLKITAAQIEATLVTINRPIDRPTEEGPGVLRTAKFTIPANNPTGMTGPVMTGTKPLGQP